MGKIIELELESGGTVLVEAEGVEESGGEGGMRRASGGAEEAIKKGSGTFDAVMENVRDSANVLIEKLRELSKAPDEIAVEFGVKVNVEGKAFIASAGAAANFKIALKWKK